jgi:hypothetical protein
VVGPDPGAAELSGDGAETRLRLQRAGSDRR